MEISTIEEFWNRYLQTLPESEQAQSYYEAFAFGGTKEQATRLARLVNEGTKTATSDLLWNREATGKPLWQVGDKHIVLDGAGTPVCVIETVELEIRPFAGVDDSFAYDYGEGERHLSWWLENLWEDYAEMCAGLGREPNREMPLICERFRVVFRRE